MLREREKQTFASPTQLLTDELINKRDGRVNAESRELIIEIERERTGREERGGVERKFVFFFFQKKLQGRI